MCDQNAQQLNIFFQLSVVMSLEYIWILKEKGFTFPELGGFNNNESEETLVFRIWQDRLATTWQKKETYTPKR